MLKPGDQGLRKHRGFWLSWFGPLGREMGCSKRWFTDNPNVFVSVVEKCIGARESCFMSVQPFMARDVVFGLEKVFLSFHSKIDSASLKETFEQVRGLGRRLREHFNVEPLIVRAWRGFHVYVFLQDIVEFGFGQEYVYKWVYRLLQEEALKGVPHSALDARCLGNLKQLARVPYSIHEGVEYSPVDLNQRPIHIKNLDVYREKGIKEDLLRRLIERAENGIKAEEILKLRNTPSKTEQHHQRRRKMLPTVLINEPHRQNYANHPWQ
ncbi:MAG: hypothetical protein ACE5OW_06170 [Candidatus Bathyarchaeia archaeon]